MAERFVNLSERQQSTVTLALADQTYRISRVVNGVRLVYSAFLKEAGALIGKAATVQEQEGLLENATQETRAKLLVEISKTVEEVEEFSRRKLDTLLRCIELLMKANGYAFDRQWWIDNGDESDYQSFVVEALMKDAPEKKTAELVAAPSIGGASPSSSAGNGHG